MYDFCMSRGIGRRYVYDPIAPYHLVDVLVADLQPVFNDHSRGVLKGHNLVGKDGNREGQLTCGNVVYLAQKPFRATGDNLGHHGGRGLLPLSEVELVALVALQGVYRGSAHARGFLYLCHGLSLQGHIHNLLLCLVWQALPCAIT